MALDLGKLAKTGVRRPYTFPTICIVFASSLALFSHTDMLTEIYLSGHSAETETYFKQKRDLKWTAHPQVLESRNVKRPLLVISKVPGTKVGLSCTEFPCVFNTMSSVVFLLVSDERYLNGEP